MALFLSEEVNKQAFFDVLPQQCNVIYDGWDNHSVYNPTYYHFCAAITRGNLDKLGGFDERYANGIAYDDNEFVERIKRLDISMEIPLEVSVFHQWHSKAEHLKVNGYTKKHERNRVIFNKLTLKETSIKKEITYFG